MNTPTTSALQHATITVAYLNQPQAGKKNWSIKTSDGTYYSVPAGLAGMFQQGGTNTITYEDKLFNGKVFHMIRDAKPAQQQASPAPAPQSQYNGGGSPSAHQSKDEHIFLCGIINQAVSSGQINPHNATEIVAVGIAAREAYAAIWAANLSGKLESQEEMSDQIPF